MKHYIVYIISLMLLFFMHSTLSNAVNIVQETCTKISKFESKVEYNFCVTTLGSDPQSSTASVGELAEISLSLSISKAKLVLETIDILLKNPKFDPFEKGASEGCQDLYSNAPNDLEAGLKALKEKDYNTANIEVSGVLTAADICNNFEDVFREKKEIPPLTNSDFMELATISLAFTNLLK